MFWQILHVAINGYVTDLVFVLFECVCKIFHGAIGGYVLVVILVLFEQDRLTLLGAIFGYVSNIIYVLVDSTWDYRWLCCRFNLCSFRTSFRYNIGSV